MRLYPSRSQIKRLKFVLDTTLWLYNSLLEERREAYRRRGIAITTKQQYAEITNLRKGDDKIGRQLRSVYRECLDGALRRLDRAYCAFFRRLSSGDVPGFPRYKSAGRWRQIDYCHGDRALLLDAPQRHVRVPGIGNMRVRRGRQIPPYGRAWLLFQNERWYACFECERVSKPLPLGGYSTGLDRGVRHLAVTSDGRKIANPRFGSRNAASVALHARAVTALTV